jgi:endonuclease/exonuclease/phosphatase family metal-dependent hydrolase
MLIRSWNLFHGHASPPSGRAYLEEMVRLACDDRPDVVCLQEVPAWALPHLAAWSAMTAVGDVAQRPRIGPLPIPTELGRKLTAVDPARLRSAFSGQANAILLSGDARVVHHDVLVLNPAPLRREQARVLGLDLVDRLAWSKERRICQAVRLDSGLVAANLHATSSPGDARIPTAEVRRAVGFVESLAREGDTVVIAGDFNVAGADAVLDGYSDPGPGIDHIVVRGGGRPPSVWPDERRRLDGRLLSDHAPIELEL